VGAPDLPDLPQPQTGPHGPAAAATDCRRGYTEPILAGGQVQASGYWMCADSDDPRDGAPLAVFRSARTFNCS
jgi:hypothetical protein